MLILPLQEVSDKYPAHARRQPALLCGSCPLCPALCDCLVPALLSSCLPGKENRTASNPLLYPGMHDNSDGRGVLCCDSEEHWSLGCDKPCEDGTEMLSAHQQALSPSAEERGGLAPGKCQVRVTDHQEHRWAVGAQIK